MRAGPASMGSVSNKPRAVLWDMDGTLVDTEPYWMAAETALVESFGGTWSHEDALQLVGSGLIDSAQELLRDLRAAGIPTGLVTMSLRRMALDVVGLIEFEAFDIVVAGDDVDNPKPHPEPYLQAAALLDVDIADVVVIEDSPTGLRAGLASGALTIGVPHIVPLDGLGAHELWATLDGRGAADLVELFGSRAAITEATR